VERLDWFLLYYNSIELLGLLIGVVKVWFSIRVEVN